MPDHIQEAAEAFRAEAHEHGYAIPGSIVRVGLRAAEKVIREAILAEVREALTGGEMTNLVTLLLADVIPDVGEAQMKASRIVSQFVAALATLKEENPDRYRTTSDGHRVPRAVGIFGDLVETGGPTRFNCSDKDCPCPCHWNAETKEGGGSGAGSPGEGQGASAGNTAEGHHASAPSPGAASTSPVEEGACDPDRPCEPNDHICKNHKWEVEEGVSGEGELRAEAEKWRITSDAHCSVLIRAEDVLLRRFKGLDAADQAEELQRLLTEFDAWLSFRGEFGEVLTAFREAFGTDTSAAALAATPEPSDTPPACGCGHVWADHGNSGCNHCDCSRTAPDTPPTSVPSGGDEAFDEAIADSMGTRGHRVALVFDGDDGLRAKLICPESGCQPATQCGFCGHMYDDPEGGGCYDCKGRSVKPGTCWIADWFEDLSATELLKGEVEVPIAVGPETGRDAPLIRILRDSRLTKEAVREWLQSEKVRLAITDRIDGFEGWALDRDAGEPARTVAYTMLPLFDAAFGEEGSGA